MAAGRSRSKRQRLGLETYASDLNPVAVLITKALVEIPPRFAGQPPVNPSDRVGGTGGGAEWRGAAGLAADVRWYGKWMRDQAWERLGHQYPTGPNGEVVIAWLWARTVRCPNPACGGEMPLVRSFWLATKENRRAWLEPIIDRDAKTVRFEVRTTGPLDRQAVAAGSKTARGAKFRCLICESDAADQHIKNEGMAGRMGKQLLALVAEGNRQRLYLSADALPSVDETSRPDMKGLDVEIAEDPRSIWCKQYGLTTFADLFVPRQLVTLATFSDLVGEARELAREHAIAAGLSSDGAGNSGARADAYADAVATYLALTVSRQANYMSALCIWSSHPKDEMVKQVFLRQTLPMAWDFGEVNPFSQSGGAFEGTLGFVVNA